MTSGCDDAEGGGRCHRNAVLGPGELQAWPRARGVSLAAYSAARKALTASLMRGASQRKAT
jgi:hypothetical protein